MADEITLTVRFDVENGSYDPGAIQVSSQSLDQSNAGCREGIQEIGTSDETLTSTNLSSKGWLYMRNMDATNFIEWGFTNAYGGKMEASEFVICRTATNADVHLKADTAACDLQYRWLED